MPSQIYFCPPRVGIMLMTLFWAYQCLWKWYVAAFTFGYTRGVGIREFNIQLKNCNSILYNPIHSFDDAITFVLFCFYLSVSYAVWKPNFIHFDIALYVVMAIIAYEGFHILYLLGIIFVQLVQFYIEGWTRNRLFNSNVVELICCSPSLINQIYFVLAVKAYLRSIG